MMNRFLPDESRDFFVIEEYVVNFPKSIVVWMVGNNFTRNLKLLPNEDGGNANEHCHHLNFVVQFTQMNRRAE